MNYYTIIQRPLYSKELLAIKDDLKNEVQNAPNKRADLQRIYAMLKHWSVNSESLIDDENLQLSDIVIATKRFGQLVQRMVRHRRMLNAIFNTELVLDSKQLQMFQAAANHFHALSGVLVTKYPVARAQLKRYLAELAPITWPIGNVGMA